MVVNRDRKALVGHVLPSFKYVLDEENVDDYLSVSGEDIAVYGDTETSRTSGYDHRIIPPSFAPWVALSAMLRSIDWERDFYFDYRTGTSMFGEQEMIYARPLYVGETLTFTGTVISVIEKQGSRAFDLVTVGYNAVDKNNAVALQGSCAFIFFK
jgi:hypothetical protein